MYMIWNEKSIKRNIAQIIFSFDIISLQILFYSQKEEKHSFQLKETGTERRNDKNKLGNNGFNPKKTI